jgi:hypothetical protein
MYCGPKNEPTNNIYLYILYMATICGRTKYIALIPLGLAGTGVSALCLMRAYSPKTEFENKYSGVIKTIGVPLSVITGAVCLVGPTVGLVASFILCDK